MADGEKKRVHSLPARESLAFDIVKFLLSGTGAASSREITEEINFRQGKSNRYSSPEIVGIIRNRKMFMSVTGYSKKLGNRWRLDIDEMLRYFKNKKYNDRPEFQDIPEMVRKYKRRLIFKSIEKIKDVVSDKDGLDNESLIDDVYSNLRELWG